MIKGEIVYKPRTNFATPWLNAEEEDSEDAKSFFKSIYKTHKPIMPNIENKIDIETFRENLRKILTLYEEKCLHLYLQGYSMADNAKENNITIKGVKDAIHRAKQKIKTLKY